MPRALHKELFTINYHVGVGSRLIQRIMCVEPALGQSEAKDRKDARHSEG